MRGTWLWLFAIPSLALAGSARADVVDGGSGAPAAAPLTFTGRGVYAFDSSVPCPLGGFATRGPNACNRVGLDDGNTTVSVDLAKHELLVTNSSAYPKKQIIADILFLGTATTKKGDVVPVGIHCKLSKDGKKLDSPNVHIHPTTRDEMVDAKIDHFTVIYDDGKTKKTVMKPEETIETMKHPSLWSRIEGLVVSVRDNLPTDKDDPTKPGYHLADVSVGLGGAGLSHDVLRAELILTKPLPAGQSSLVGVMQGTEGEFKLTALSHLLPKDALNRDLFLLGLDKLPAVQGVLKDGLKKGESVVVAVKPDHADLQVGGQTSEVPNAQEVMRDYLEFSFLGAILDRQAQEQLATLSTAASAKPASPPK